MFPSVKVKWITLQYGGVLISLSIAVAVGR